MQRMNSQSDSEREMPAATPVAPPLTMRDQASELRSLVLRSARQRLDQTGPAPRLIVVAGGQLNVGATTLAVNLSAAFAEQGARVVLVDADFVQPDVASFCGVTPRLTITDLLDAGRDVHEVLERGPGGIQIVPGQPNAAEPFTQPGHQRLIVQLRSLGRYADVVVLDVGSGCGDTTRRLWQAADQIVLVTTPDATSIMETYANVKTLLAGASDVPLHLVINRLDEPSAAEDIFLRIDGSCQRFLGKSVRWAGCLSTDVQIANAARLGIPVVHSETDSNIARQLLAMATELSLDWQAGSEMRRHAA